MESPRSDQKKEHGRPIANSEIAVHDFRQDRTAGDSSLARKINPMEIPINTPPVIAAITVWVVW